MPTPQSLVADSLIQTGYGKFGRPMSMVEAAAMQAQQQEMARHQQLVDNWPAISQKLKGLPPTEAFNLLVPVLGPDNAVKVLEQLRIGESQQQMQEFITGGAGSGNGGASGGSAAPVDGRISALPDEKLVVMAGAEGGMGDMARAEIQRRQANKQFTATEDYRNRKFEDKASNDLFDQETKLRDEFGKKSADFIAQRDAYSQIEAAASDPSGAGDMAMIFSYMKMLDPGSTVREGEYAVAEQVGSIPQRVVSMYNKAVDGEKLAPEVRQDFVSRSEKLFTAAKKQQDKTIKIYTGLAKRKKIDPDNVILDFSGPDEEAAPSPDATRGEDGNWYRINPATGKKQMWRP